jgi:ABC-type lipoprotein release transport system permease subunit
VVRLVTIEALSMTAAGAAAGIALAAWLTRYLESRLFGIERFDALTFGAALAVVAIVSLAAAIIPATRAARIDPVVALRQ